MQLCFMSTVMFSYGHRKTCKHFFSLFLLCLLGVQVPEMCRSLKSSDQCAFFEWTWYWPHLMFSLSDFHFFIYKYLDYIHLGDPLQNKTNKQTRIFLHFQF